MISMEGKPLVSRSTGLVCQTNLALEIAPGSFLFLNIRRTARDLVFKVGRSSSIGLFQAGGEKKDKKIHQTTNWKGNFCTT